MSIEPLTRARRREMTRRHLMDAAAVVFARDGFHRASLDDVAATAGFTKGAVYSNFASKDDLFLAVFEDRYQREQDEMQRVLTQHDAPYELGGETDVFADVRGVIDRTWDDEWTALYLEFVLYAQRHAEAAKKLAESIRRQREITVAMLDEAYKSIDYEPDVPVEVLAKIAIALFDGLALGRLADPPAFDDEMLTHFLNFMIMSIGANNLDADESGGATRLGWAAPGHASPTAPSPGE
jgi:AcrR family transcriptional regulator